MQRLLAVLAILTLCGRDTSADDFLSEDQRETLIAKAREFQNIARGKAIQLQASTEIKFAPQIPDKRTLATEQPLGPHAAQKLEYSLVTDGLRFCGSSNTSDRRRIDACFDGSKTVMVVYENDKPKNTVKKEGIPSYTSPDSNIAGGAMIAYTKYSVGQKLFDGLLGKFDDTFVVSFLRVADGIVEKTDESGNKIFEAKIDLVPVAYSIRLRSQDGACTQFKIEGADASVGTISNTFSSKESSQLLSMTRTLRLKNQLVINATTTYKTIGFVELQQSLFTLEVDPSVPLQIVK